MKCDLGKDIYLEDLEKNYDAIYIAFKDPNYLAGEDMKVKDYSKVFSTYPILTTEKKGDFYPIIGLSRKAVQIIDDFLIA